MTEATIESATAAAEAKAVYLRENPLGYLVLALLAGTYIGFGIVLIFAIGAPLLAANSPAAKLAMGASFGIALALVIFAGSELFTGNTMVMTIGLLRGRSSPLDLALVWLFSFAGNLLGGLLLAWIVARTGVLGAAPHLAVIQSAVAAKMHLSFGVAFWRGVLCNWLVCLAVWTAMRTTSDAGKLIMIFWCLFAFIAAGFEHSVANMTLLAIGLLQSHPATITVAGMVRNLVPVTLGNIVGGGLFVGGAYWFANARLPSLSGRAARRREMLEPADGAAAD
jgi:nitrite transporter